jgi:hypothetical protein
VYRGQALHNHVSQHLLQSGTASAAIASRFDVDDWCVRVLDCPDAAETFERTFTSRTFSLINNPKLWMKNRTSDTDARRNALKLLDSVVADATVGNSSASFFQTSATWQPPKPRIVLAWRADEYDTVGLMCRDGFETLRERDGGFFGHGLYFTLEAAVAATYTAKMAKPCLVLYAVSIAQPYPVTLAKDYNAAAGGVSKLCGAPLTLLSDAHVIPVREWGTTNPFNPSTKYEHSVFSQAADIGDAHGYGPDGTELCVAHTSQCVPLLCLLRTQTAAALR